MGILGWTTTFLLTKYLSNSSGKSAALMYENFTVNILFESVFVFCICKRLFYEKRQDKEMPSYPDDGSIAIINDIVVVKF